MFQSATLKLTGWYLLILMTISILFSVAIFEITTNEFSSRLERFERSLEISPGVTPQPLALLRSNEISIASVNIIKGLLLANALILCVGGAVSYLLARRTLRPIQTMHEAQSRFTSDASHELRTPLAAMKTEIEVALRDKSATKKDLEAVMKSNLEEVDKLTSLSQMLLNLSRLDHEKLKKTSVNLSAVTRDVVRAQKTSSNRLIVTSPKKILVLGNETAIVELVSILVDNALKYSPNDSSVVINISKHRDQASFEIINSGQGIDADKLPYIFDRFYRADSSRTNRVGYGLGLSLAKKIVELSKGELSVVSTPGQSTIFTVMLPLVQTSPRQAKTTTK
jgi:signal transduction histidine kinase